jgi:hypothetical protein
MADFRKWFLVLVVVGLFTSFAVSANAQVTGGFQCTANAGVPPLLRAEGITELVGDLLLNCTGNVPAEGITANIRIFLNTNVTSRLLGGSSAPSANEALLLIDDPAPADQNLWRVSDGLWAPGDPLPNVFQGLWTGVSTVDWLGIPIVAPGSSGVDRRYRITNVRANASQLGTSSSLIPTQVFMFISISGTTSVPVNNPQQIVGYVVPGLSFSATGVALRQCAPPSENDTITLKFTEGFATAFKVQGGTGQTMPGAVYDTESGLTIATGFGLADQGTELQAKFVGIPDGVKLSVPASVQSSVGPSAQTLELVGSTSITPSGGTATVLYEVVGDAAQVAVSSGNFEYYTVPVTIVYSSIPPDLTPTAATVAGSFAPTSTLTTARTSSTPIPRFVDVSEAKAALTISPCRTLLLFPYVTNAAMFDTGLIISNTSDDPFGTENQSGTCELNYFGNLPATLAPAPSPVTTPEINAGEQLAIVMSSGGAVVGSTDPPKACAACATPGFQGYIIAVCDFQYAHGFAFVSDLGASKLAEGYLALIIPDRGGEVRVPDAFTVGAQSNDGEQLVH